MATATDIAAADGRGIPYDLDERVFVSTNPEWRFVVSSQVVDVGSRPGPLFDGPPPATCPALPRVEAVRRPSLIALAPYRIRDKGAVFRLLAILPRLYPRGHTWLDARLDDAAAGDARCTLAYIDNILAGVTIETPKGPDRLKLSTIWVAPWARNRGIGTALLDAAHGRWIREARDEVLLTADVNRAPGVHALAARFGFQHLAVEWERYGPDRHEAIFRWKPHSR